MDTTLVSQNRLMQSIDRRRRELSELGPCMNGSLCRRAGKCANPDCECHKGVRMHFSWQVTQAENGRTHTIYIPADMVDQVRGWTENHRKARKLMKEISALCEKYIRSAVPKLRAGLKRKARLSAAEEGNGHEQ